MGLALRPLIAPMPLPSSNIPQNSALLHNSSMPNTADSILAAAAKAPVFSSIPARTENATIKPHIDKHAVTEAFTASVNAAAKLAELHTVCGSADFSAPFGANMIPPNTAARICTA